MKIECSPRVKIRPDDQVIDLVLKGGQHSPLAERAALGNYHRILLQLDRIFIQLEERPLLQYQSCPSIILWISKDILQLPQQRISHILNGLLAPLGICKKLRVTITYDTDGDVDKAVEAALFELQFIHSACKMAMLPANKGTPKYLAKELQKTFLKYKEVTAKVLTYTQLKKQGLELICSVGESAENPPCMLVVERGAKGSKGAKRVCLIGKGVTFDSGGLALKDIKNMDTMKYDKIGGVYAASVLEGLIASSDLNHIHFIGIFPFAENAVSEFAKRPGDVVRSYLGKTVEIANPDAEGRMLLADALAFSHSYRPDLILDMATLTGHADVINCWHSAYYFAQPLGLKRDIEELGESIGERVLPMPNWLEYKVILKSPVADLSNSPIGCSNSFTAALFLHEFVPKGADWVHMDLTHVLYNHQLPTGKGIRIAMAIVRKWADSKK